jgi:two-component system, NarL family, response regulator NreC
MSQLSVFLADDHTVLRHGLRRIIDADPELQVVGEAGDGHSAVDLVRQLRPAVVLMDIGLPLLNGIDATRLITKSEPNVKVIILSMHADQAYVRRSLEAGARGYVLKDAEDLDLVRAIKAVARGGSFFSPAVSDLIRDGYLSPPGLEGRDGVDKLSDRERQVLQLIAEGRVNKEIAVLLDVSLSTIESHRKRIMEKLDLHNTAALVRFAIRHRLVEA